MRGAIGAATIILVMVSAVSNHEPKAEATGEDRLDFSYLDELWGTSDADAHAQLTGTRGQQVRAFVRSRLSQESFYDSMTESMFKVFGAAETNLFSDTTAFVKPIRFEKGVYFLREPCKKDEQVDVTPWWDRANVVRVCRDSYRPNTHYVESKGVKTYCERSWPETCGCGPNLMYCAPRQLYRQIVEEMRQEPVRTIQHIVQTDAPFSEILRTKTTVRAGVLDLYYQRSLYSEESGLATISADEMLVRKPRPRPAPFGGGVLSTPLFRSYETPRTIMMLVYDDYLCAPFVSRTVRAEETVALSNPSLRFDGLMELATKKGCETCHARLEYGMQAFRGFTTPIDGSRYVLERQVAHDIPFKFHNSRDERAVGPATPSWFGRTMTEQPEFHDCIVSRTTSWLFSGRKISPALHTKLKAVFAERESFEELVTHTVASLMQVPWSEL